MAAKRTTAAKKTTRPKSEAELKLRREALNGKPSAHLTPCSQCGEGMNPAEVMLGPVCGKCCRKNQRRVTGR